MSDHFQPGTRGLIPEYYPPPIRTDADGFPLTLENRAKAWARTLPKEVFHNRCGGWSFMTQLLPTEVSMELPAEGIVCSFADALAVLHWAVERAFAKGWTLPVLGRKAAVSTYADTLREARDSYGTAPAEIAQLEAVIRNREPPEAEKTDETFAVGERVRVLDPGSDDKRRHPQVFEAVVLVNHESSSGSVYYELQLDDGQTTISHPAMLQKLTGRPATPDRSQEVADACQASLARVNEARQLIAEMTEGAKADPKLDAQVQVHDTEPRDGWRVRARTEARGGFF